MRKIAIYKFIEGHTNVIAMSPEQIEKLIAKLREYQSAKETWKKNNSDGNTKKMICEAENIIEALEELMNVGTRQMQVG